MNCREFAAALDEGTIDDLSETARAALDTHAAACPDCADALAAHEALVRDRIPGRPAALGTAALLARRRDGAPAPSLGRRRRRRRAAAVTLFGFAGVAFAAVSILVVHGYRTGVDGAADTAPAAPQESAAAAAGGDAVEAAVASPIDYLETAEAAESERFNARLMSAPALPDGEMFPLLHVPPVYPPEAAERKIEGYAVGEFTVTPAGDVANVHIFESSDPAFDQSTIDALQRSKYKPRVVDGRAVAVDGVRVKITYVLQDPNAQRSENLEPPQTPPEPKDAPDWREFNSLLADTLDCLKSSDLDCIELNVDRIRSTYSLTKDEQSKLWRIEGFVQHRLGNYERAIEAYEEAAALDAQPDSATWMIVAHIYYEREQYQPALDAALKFLKTARHPSAADYVFVDRLRQLGAVVR